MANEITSLKRIQAPILSTNYGKNIKQTFKDIDSNFGSLNNTDLVKGDPGVGLLSVSISFRDLLSGDDYNMGDYSIQSQYPGITAAFERVPGCNNEDVTSIISQLSNLQEGGVLLCYKTPSDNETLVDISSAIAFTYYDERFRHITGDASDLAEATDMTGTLCYVNDPDNPHWEVTQNLPTLYYKEGKGLCWIIAGNKTDIIAQGPNGADGTRGEVYIVIAGSAENPFVHPTGDTVDQCQIYQIWSATRATSNEPVDAFMSIADYVSSGEIIQDKTPCIIIPYPANTDNNIYYISTIIYRNNEAFANISSKNAIYNVMNNYTVKQAFSSITTANDSSNVIHGYFIPYNATTEHPKNGYIYYVDINNGQAYLSLVSDYDSPIGSSVDTGVFNIHGSVAEGIGTSASGTGSHAEGSGSIASGQNSHAEGIGATASGTGSHAEGEYTTAYGTGSHTEGHQTNAWGEYSHTEGEWTHARGIGSHAEGNGAIASGSYSHAEGEYTNASGTGSHAEGNGTRASGSYSHAEGNGAIASGSAAHAEGHNTKSFGNYSHAEGESTQTLNPAEHACGIYNKSGKMWRLVFSNKSYYVILSDDEHNSLREPQMSYEVEVGQIIFSIGCGSREDESSTENRKNAFCVANQVGGYVTFWKPILTLGAEKHNFNFDGGTKSKYLYESAF